jgi:cystathionine beta-lyase/cystathionine gamma-synthase
MKKQSKADKLIDKQIDLAYRETCSNIEVNIMDIPRIFEECRKAILAGSTNDELKIVVREFVESIRKN